MFVNMFKVTKPIVAIVNYVMGKIDSEVLFSSIPDNQGKPSNALEDVEKFCVDFMKKFGKNSFGHLIISSDDSSLGENKERWKNISLDALERLSMSHAPCVVALHRDGGSPHVHGLLTFFKIGFVLGEESFLKEEFKHIPNKEFNLNYRERKPDIVLKCKTIARQLEQKHSLKRDTLNIHIGRDRYLRPEYSLKHYMKLAYHELLETATSLKEFLCDLAFTCQKYLKNWGNNMKNVSKSPMRNLMGSAPEVTFEITKSPIKQFEERILFKIGKGNFKISDYKIDKGLDLASVNEQLEENSKKATSEDKDLLSKFVKSATHFDKKPVKLIAKGFVSTSDVSAGALTTPSDDIRLSERRGGDTSTDMVISSKPEDPLIPLAGASSLTMNTDRPQPILGNSDIKERRNQINLSAYEGNNNESSIRSFSGLSIKPEASFKEAPNKSVSSQPSSEPCRTPDHTWIDFDIIMSQYTELGRQYEMEKEREKQKRLNVKEKERALSRRNMGNFQPDFYQQPENNQQSSGLSL